MTNLVTFGTGRLFRAYTAQKDDLGVATTQIAPRIRRL